MCELRTILNHSDQNSLIIGDEVCSGTESNSAKSIFTAAIEWLHNKNSSFIFATHFHEINKYEEINTLKKLNKMHMSVIYDVKLDCLIYDRKLKEGPGEDMYGLEVCKSLNLSKEFLNRTHDLRIKYGTNHDILSLNSSIYNSQKIKGNCELCGNKGDDTHHMAYQKNANERNYINGHHKNHPANLMILCNICHQKIHKENLEHRRTLTSDGYKYLELTE
jgi:DNA mismatch repair protein MutS